MMNEDIETIKINDIEYVKKEDIKKLITILNQFDSDEVVFAFKKCCPLIAGNFEVIDDVENKRKIRGVIIAPKILDGDKF